MASNESSNFNMNADSVKAWRTGIKVIAYLIYVAAALFATIIFSNHISGAFPDDPLMRFLASAGSWANFGSLILMPLAKEYWVHGREMTLAAWVFWAIEFIMVVFNVLAAYGSEWATWWTPLSPASPVIVIAIWGLLWYLNPEAKMHQEQVDFYVSTQQKWMSQLKRSIDHPDIQAIMNDGAMKAARQYTEKSLNVIIDPNHQGLTRANPKQTTPTVYNNAEVTGPDDLVARVVAQLKGEQGGGGNGADPTKPR